MMQLVQYDNRPEKLQANGDGSFRYRWNIHAITVEQPDGESREQWQCNEVIVYAPITSNKILQAAITAMCDRDREAKLINDFNSISLGLVDVNSDDATSKSKAYSDFLLERAIIKAQVDADCKELNVQ